MGGSYSYKAEGPCINIKHLDTGKGIALQDIISVDRIGELIFFVKQNFMIPYITADNVN